MTTNNNSYLPSSTPETGANAQCPCGASNQHSLSQSGKCDAMRKGKLDSWQQNVGKKL